MEVFLCAVVFKTWRIEMCPGSHKHILANEKDVRGHVKDYSHYIVLIRTSLLMNADMK